jgi:hypothetical protein
MALWNVAAPMFIPAGFCQLLTVLCQVTLPLLVRELLRVLEDNPSMNVVSELRIQTETASLPLPLVSSKQKQSKYPIASGLSAYLPTAVVQTVYSHSLTA